MADRIRPPRDLESTLDRLKDDGLFETKQKGMMFAAAVGYALRKDHPGGIEPKGYGEGIRIEYFERVRDAGFIDALAVAERHDLHFLADERSDDRTDLFERYAAVGLERLKRYCYDRPGDPLQGLLDLIDQLSSPQQDELPGLDAEVEEIDRLLT